MLQAAGVLYMVVAEAGWGKMLRAAPESLMGGTDGFHSMHTHKPEMQQWMAGGSGSVVGHESRLGEDTATALAGFAGRLLSFSLSLNTQKNRDIERNQNWY